MLNAEAGLGIRIRGAVPAIGGPYGLSIRGTALYNNGSEFYRIAGSPSDPDPGLFIANRVRRAGGVLCGCQVSRRRAVAPKLVAPSSV